MRVFKINSTPKTRSPWTLKLVILKIYKTKSVMVRCQGYAPQILIKLSSTKKTGLRPFLDGYC